MVLYITPFITIGSIGGFDGKKRAVLLPFWQHPKLRKKVWSPHGDVGEQRSQRQRWGSWKKRYPRNAGGERNNRTLGNRTENASPMFKYVWYSMNPQIMQGMSIAYPWSCSQICNTSWKGVGNLYCHVGMLPLHGALTKMVGISHYTT